MQVLLAISGDLPCDEHERSEHIVRFEGTCIAAHEDIGAHRSRGLKRRGIARAR